MQTTVGEIDHAYDAVDHRVADGDQAIDASQRQAVDELLGEILQTVPAPCRAGAAGLY